MPEADQMQVMRDLATRADTSTAAVPMDNNTSVTQAGFLGELAVDETGHCCSHTDWL